jgi:hypothetical protein
VPRHAILALAALALPACPARPKAPRVPPVADVTLPLVGAIRGVAGDGTSVYTALETGTTTAIRAQRAGAEAWHVELPGRSGPLAATPALTAATVTATPELGAGAVRGDPAAAVVALDAATGAKQWAVLFDSTEWAVVTAIAPLGADLVVAGTFGGTLRAKSRVVSSAGGSDGFVARLSPTGDVRWLVRVGGAGADGVQGVATRGDRIAIAGTFTAGAELAGVALPAYDESSPFGDAFAAELDGNGARRWTTTFGGRADDAVAGVAIDERGNIVVASSTHEVVHVGSAQLVTQGASDGIVAWFGEGGEKGPAVLLGGLDFDGLRAITAVGDRVIVGGFFSGSIQLADRTLTAGGGDDSFIAALDPNGTVAMAWHVGGDGREEVTSLAAIPGGFVAGIAHTAAAAIEDAKLPAPKDPMQGSVLIVRGLR